MLTRRVDPFMLRSLISTIKLGESIEIHYQSMYAAPHEELWRRITPHAFGFDGLRWHVRSYCHRDKKFRDFILSRIGELRNKDVSGASPLEDESWHTFFNVVLKANPLLTESQRFAIERDYGMQDGHVIVPVRYALLYYFEKRLRLDVGDLDRLEQTPIVVKNIDEFKIARANGE